MVKHRAGNKIVIKMTNDGEQPESPASSVSLSAEIKKKRRQRGGHKAYITTVLATTTELLTAELDSKNILKLKQQKISSEERLKTIKELDNQILDLLIEEKDIETEITEAGQYSDSIYETLLKIDEALTINQKEKEKAENVRSASSIQPNSGVTYGGVKAKSPKLIIRKFYGAAHKYQEFWDSFESPVHENTSLSPIDKFNYLRTLIEEPTYSAVAGLSLTEANYEAALELLKKRYGQRQTIINSHIDAILKIEPL